MVFMDNETKKSLDFQYILDSISPTTPIGRMYKGRLGAYLPGEEEELEEELNRIGGLLPLMKDREIRRNINNILSHVKDIRNSIRRARDGMILTEVELFEIKLLLFVIREIYEFMEDHNFPKYYITKIEPIEELEKALDPEGTKISTFYIYDDYSEELKKVRKEKQEIDRELKLKTKEIRNKIKEEFNITVQPNSTVVVSKSDDDTLNKLDTYPYLTYVSETYMNIKFKIKNTEEMEAMEKRLTVLLDREEREEEKVREDLSKLIGKMRKQVFRNIANIGRLDLLLAKAKYAIDIDGVKPEITRENIIEIDSGVHPKVSDFLRTKDLNFTPISISLNQGATCITGANMGGKSVSLKLVGLLTAMAQYGLYVPAKSMKLGLKEYIESSIGDMQSTDSGLSTFGGEIKIVSKALAKSNKPGLILIDELARGTNPEEGHAISKAIVEYLKDKEPITLLTTHYDNIANSEGVQHLQVKGLASVDFEKLTDDIDIDEKMDFINRHMDYRLESVGKEESVPRDALNIASIMGLDRKIIKIAENYLEKK